MDEKIEVEYGGAEDGWVVEDEDTIGAKKK